MESVRFLFGLSGIFLILIGGVLLLVGGKSNIKLAKVLVGVGTVVCVTSFIVQNDQTLGRFFFIAAMAIHLVLALTILGASLFKPKETLMWWHLAIFTVGWAIFLIVTNIYGPFSRTGLPIAGFLIPIIPLTFLELLVPLGNIIFAWSGVDPNKVWRVSGFFCTLISLISLVSLVGV